jgi:hypothetical protein
MKFAFLQLRFISARNNEKADSLINIKKNGEDRFVWIFRAPESKNGKRITDAMLVSRNEVLANLKSFVQLHEFDSDPFESMQILAPGFPSVLVLMNKVPLAFGTISNFLNIIFDNWPQVTTFEHALKYIDNDYAGELLHSTDEEDDETATDEYTEAEEEEAEEEDEDAGECQTRCAEENCPCEHNPTPSEPLTMDRGHHLGRYFINGIPYVPEATDDDMPDLVPFPRSETSHNPDRPSTPIQGFRTPQRPSRDDFVPHCPGAPARIHRTTTMTSTGPRVHTYFS